MVDEVLGVQITGGITWSSFSLTLESVCFLNFSFSSRLCPLLGQLLSLKQLLLMPT